MKMVSRAGLVPAAAKPAAEWLRRKVTNTGGSRARQAARVRVTRDGSLMVKRAGRYSGVWLSASRFAKGLRCYSCTYPRNRRNGASLRLCTSAFRAAASLKGKAPSRSPGQMGRKAHRREHVCHRALSARRSSPAPFLEAAPAR